MRTNTPSSAPRLVLPKARGRPPTASSRCCSSSAARMRWSPLPMSTQMRWLAGSLPGWTLPGAANPAARRPALSCTRISTTRC